MMGGGRWSCRQRQGKLGGGGQSTARILQEPRLVSVVAMLVRGSEASHAEGVAAS